MNIGVKKGSKSVGVKHIGFQGAVQSVEKKEGLPKEEAAAVIAAGARNASKAAHTANPKLSNVKG